MNQESRHTPRKDIPVFRAETRWQISPLGRKMCRHAVAQLAGWLSQHIILKPFHRTASLHNSFLRAESRHDSRDKVCYTDFEEPADKFRLWCFHGRLSGQQAQYLKVKTVKRRELGCSVFMQHRKEVEQVLCCIRVDFLIWTFGCLYENHVVKSGIWVTFLKSGEYNSSIHFQSQITMQNQPHPQYILIPETNSNSLSAGSKEVRLLFARSGG